MCTAAMQPKLIESFKAALAEFSPAGPLTENVDYSAIVNPAHFERVSKLVDGTKGRIAIGGTRNAATNKIEVTVVADVQKDDVLMAGASPESCSSYIMLQEEG